jgi:AcrR family transcriptional regulator
MAKRQPGAFDTWELDAPQLQDRSAELWDDSYGPVARRLLTSATRCYASKGFQATTTRDISGGAGLSPAAMYVHFPSKEAILFEIARTAHVKALDDMRSPAQDDLVERIWHIVYRHVAWNARYHVAARVAQYELANLTPENYASIREIRRETNRVYRRGLRAHRHQTCRPGHHRPRRRPGPLVPAQRHRQPGRPRRVLRRSRARDADQHTTGACLAHRAFGPHAGGRARSLTGDAGSGA